jgi:hypothetical protein
VWCGLGRGRRAGQLLWRLLVRWLERLVLGIRNPGISSHTKVHRKLEH